MRPPTSESVRRRVIAERIATAYERHASPRAILLAGSAGEGTADEWSDVDLIAYYDRLPEPASIEAWRAELDVRRPTSQPSPELGWTDNVVIDDVECQTSGQPVARVEHRIGDLLAGREPG